SNHALLDDGSGTFRLDRLDPFSHGPWRINLVGRFFLTRDLAWAEPPDRASLIRLWQIHDLPDDLPPIAAWVTVLTGLELDDRGEIHPLDYSARREQRERLRQLGGPPVIDQETWLDPILHGPDPLARARAWIDRGRWAEAEAAFTEVIEAWPYVDSFWAER